MSNMPLFIRINYSWLAQKYLKLFFAPV